MELAGENAEEALIDQTLEAEWRPSALVVTPRQDSSTTPGPARHNGAIVCAARLLVGTIWFLPIARGRCDRDALACTPRGPQG